ncbi:MAG TPA: tRNA (adenosine(37)-N6)-threonylcarbamoyltransferase complex dimerization subunit type 1 TsaB, partial [Chthoniobacterales bacterium]
MKILALELSTARGSLAWGNGELVEQEWPNDRKNSGPFFQFLKSAVVAHGSPETIVIGLGPGSYAGVRIALSTAMGLQAASQARMVGLPSICAMPCEERSYAVIGDARRQSFFLGRIENRALLSEPELLSETELRTKLSGLGTWPVFSSDELPQFAGVRRLFPSAARLARLAAEPNCRFALPPLQP